MEERRTAELLSDFDDYEIGEPDGTVRSLRTTPAGRKGRPAEGPARA